MDLDRKGASGRELDPWKHRRWEGWVRARALEKRVKHVQLSPWEVEQANQTWWRGSKESRIRQGLPL